MTTPGLFWTRLQRSSGGPGHKGFHPNAWGAYGPAWVLGGGGGASELRTIQSRSATREQLSSVGLLAQGQSRSGPRGTQVCRTHVAKSGGGQTQVALLEVTAGLGGIRGGHRSKEGLLAGSIENQGVQLGRVCDTLTVRCFTVGTPVSLGRDEGGAIIPILWRRGEERARPQITKLERPGAGV